MQEQIGRFHILKRLGGGGFGEVYLGRDDMLGRDVAIKIFKPKDDNLVAFATSTDDEGYEVLKARFLNEARILSQLENATYVVSVLDFGELDDGSPYYVMPFLARSLVEEVGRDIFDVQAIDELPEPEKPRALPLSKALGYLHQLLQALASAHEESLIHRDIKPANVMLNDKDEIRLVDFGIAKAPEGQHSTVSQLGMGSRNYMAPEQMESAKHVDARADVYAFGVLAYRILTGRLPKGRFADPNVYAEALSKGLNDLILECLSEERSQRPNDAQLLLTKWEKAAAQQNAPVNEDESTGTWVGEGTSGLKDEIKPLREYIINLLNTHAEIPDEEKDQLDALAAVADLDHAGLQALIEECQQTLHTQLKPKQNLLKLIDSKVQDNTLDTEATRSAIYTAGESVGWSSDQLDTIIERKTGGSNSKGKKKRKSAVAQNKSNSNTDSQRTSGTAQEKPSTPSKLPKAIAALLVVGSLVGGGVFYSDYQAQQQLLAEQAAIAKAKAKAEAERKRQRLIAAHVGKLVSIPAGSFQMGSTKGGGDEKPVHKVNIKAFKMMAKELTWAQYQPCIDEGVCSYRSNDQGWGKANRPVINVSWDDAQTYIKWLNKKTGERFRLPSEAEWEYAARARSTTKYSWGDNISCTQARYGQWDNGCGSEKKTVPIASYAPNAFGLYDMHGNVWEWTQDCWHDSYRNAPSDGRAWESANGGDCSDRVLRGGSWYNKPDYLRSADRNYAGTAARFYNLGFRLVQGG